MSTAFYITAGISPLIYSNLPDVSPVRLYMLSYMVFLVVSKTFVCALGAGFRYRRQVYLISVSRFSSCNQIGFGR